MNSTITFVIASTLEMTLHEFSHFVTSLIAHANNTVLYHNYVSNNTDQISTAMIIFIKAAGPIASLAIGLVFHSIISKQTKRNLLFLFYLYMSVFGYIGLLGYLMIAPIFSYGDTGYIFEALHFPSWLTICIAILAAIILYLIMRQLMKYFVSMGTVEIIQSKEKRSTFINSLIFYPLIFGIIITTLLNIPVPTFASLIAPLFSPFAIMWAYGMALRTNYSSLIYNSKLDSINSKNYRWQLLFVLTVFINRLLVEGFHLN